MENNLDQKTSEIFKRIETIKTKNPNIFLLNLWKNYILNKKVAYLQTLNDCEKFLSETENTTYANDISYETILLLYSLSTTMNT